MPTGSLSGKGKKLWEQVYNASKADGDSEEVAARKAWAAVESAGWHKDKDGNWVKKSDLTEFSLFIKSSFDPETKQMRWKASASDIDEDSYSDNMSVELYQDFIRRIETGELAPEQFRSDFWEGGMPYLSISHYPDLDGSAVPGVIEASYVDGDCNKACFKSRGLFSDTPIGLASFKAVEDNPNQPEDNKVRISIGFLDWKHQHKSNGYLFERQEIDDICPECLKEAIKGKSQGKIFLAGQLVHEALTRKPANKRTEMEVDKSMTTRKEDAESIIGEELAEEIEKKAKLVGKSEALVVKAEDEPVVEVEKANVEETPKEDGKDTGVIEKCGDPIPVVVVGETEPWKPFGGATSLKEAQETIAAQKEQFRISDLWYALQSVMENIFANESITDKSSAITKAVNEFKAMIADKSASIYNSLITLSLEQGRSNMDKPIEVAPHVLDAVISKFKSDFDDAIAVSNLSVDDRLKLLQPSLEQLAETTREQVSISAIPIQEPVQVSTQGQSDLVQALSEVMKPIQQQLGLLTAQMIELKKPVVSQAQPVIVPERRSLNPQLIQQRSAVVKSETPKLRAIVERTT